MLISGFQKSSLIDYPKKIAAIIFTQGCNFKCPYCHNPELNKFDKCVMEKEFSIAHIIDYLKTRKGKLDGVVITGGEPTLYSDLPEIIKEIKALNFLVKLDTNGTNPDMLQSLIDEKLIDYAAMDIKSPLEKYAQTVCCAVNTEKIKQSIDILKQAKIDYEFRTTVVKSQLSIEDFEKIGKLLNGSKRYYLQKFVPTKTLDETYLSETTYSDIEFKQIINLLCPYIENVLLR